MNNCIYIRKRKNKPFCKLLNKEIEFSQCRRCEEKEYKPKKIYKIKQRTYKQAKAEANRYSILTDDLEHCIICGKAPINKHEIFYGSNRHNSIKWGLVIPLCTAEHHVGNAIGIHADKELDRIWKKKGQLAYMKHYNKNIDEFISVFGKNYLD
jgi:hypothetical protein